MTIYEKRERNAEIRMSENSEIETLSEEQHIALARLCKIRHEIHCNNESMFNAQSSSYSNLWSYIDSDNSNSIYQMLDNVNLDNNLCWNRDMIPDSEDYDKEEVDGGFEIDDYDEAFDICISFLRRVNNDIEKFLRKIDKEHGTSYCPTGATRFL